VLDFPPSLVPPPRPFPRAISGCACGVFLVDPSVPYPCLFLSFVSSMVFDLTLSLVFTLGFNFLFFPKGGVLLHMGPFSPLVDTDGRLYVVLPQNNPWLGRCPKGSFAFFFCGVPDFFSPQGFPR